MAGTNTIGNHTDPTKTEPTINNDPTKTEPTQKTEPAQKTEPTATELEELARLRAENAKLKNANDKLSSENGNLNKSLKAKLSAEEIEAEEKAKREAAQAEYVKTLERDRDLNIAAKRYMSMGMSEEMATETANYELDKDMESVSRNIKKNQERLVAEEVKKEQEKWIASRPQANIGTGGDCPVTKEQFNRMGYKERAKFYTEHPETYKEYTK